MKVTAKTALLTAMMTVGIPTVSAETGRADSSSVACFAQTQRIGAADRSEPLSTASCEQALTVAPYTREHRASVLFNRALIEQANGDGVAAMLSFDAALVQDPSLVEAKLARAQLAHQMGDYAAAVIGYAELLEKHGDSLLVRRHQQALERNLGSARRALSVLAAR